MCPAPVDTFLERFALDVLKEVLDSGDRTELESIKEVIELV